MFLNKNKLIISVFLATLAIIFLIPLSSKADEGSVKVYLDPDVKNYTVGDLLQVTVRLDSPDQAVNAAGLLITYPEDYLRVVALSQAGSVFSYWPVEPTVKSGQIRFSGGLVDPGFQGTGVQLLHMTFRIIRAGTAELRFHSGSVHANDGKGTNILNSLYGGTYNIRPAISEPDPLELKQTAKAVVQSSTHPDPSAWYDRVNVKLEWSMPDSVNSISYAWDQQPLTNPGKNGRRVIDNIEYQNVSEGIWYFHIRVHNYIGWGETVHYPVHIDSRAPESFLVITAENPTLNPEPLISYQAFDQQAGIDHYEIKVDSQPFTWTKEESYKLSGLLPGEHMVIVKAIDRAGNSTVAFLELTILPLPQPLITDYPTQLSKKEYFFMTGQAEPGSQVKIFVIDKDGNQQLGQAGVDDQGAFSYIHRSLLNPGVYQVSAQTLDVSGAVSLPTIPIQIEITQPVFMRIGSIVVSYYAIIVIMLALLMLLLLLLFYLWDKYSNRKRIMKTEIDELAHSIDFGFARLRQDILSEIDDIRDRERRYGLTDKERSKLDKLQVDLDIVEGYIQKELTDIEDVQAGRKVIKK